MSPRPLSDALGPTDLRRHHLSLILDLLRRGPASRADLAKETRLTKATVSTLVSDLLVRCMVTELEPRSGQTGRPATLVALRSATVAGLGLQIEADNVTACAIDLAGDVVSFFRQRSDNRRARTETVVRRLAIQARAVLDELASRGCRHVGTTLAIPGLVEPGTRTVFVAPNLEWSQVDLTGLPFRLGLEPNATVTVDNEANLGALAEIATHAVDAASDFVYVSGGVGVGAGIVAGRRLVRGAHGFGGEIGHLVVDPRGEQCACGARGCLETIVGTDRPTSTSERADALSRALSVVVHLLDPGLIVLGGSFGQDQPLADMVAERLRSSTLAGRWAPCEVRSSQLGLDAVVRGAALHALESVLADPTIVPADDSVNVA